MPELLTADAPELRPATDPEIAWAAVDPITDPELQIQPSSIDLRLANTFVVYKLPHVPCIDARDPNSVEAYTETIEIPDGEGFVLQPGAFRLYWKPAVETRVEIIDIREHYAIEPSLLSTLARNPDSSASQAASRGMCSSS